MATVKTERIGDFDVEIEVDAGGMFSATVPIVDDELRDKTLEGLIDKLKAAIKKASAQKPLEVTIYDATPRDAKKDFYSSSPITKGRGLVHCILRGWSERRRAPLVTLDGKKFVLDEYSLKQQFARRFTASECLEYERLTQAVDGAQAALDEFLKARTIDPRDAMSPAGV